MSLRPSTRSLTALIIAATALAPRALYAQAPAAAPSPAAPDAPSIKVGMTWFGDYTYQKEPTIADADGNTVHPSSFNVTRAYINVTGNITHMIAFRITPDIARESGAGTSLAGSLEYRLKYAYAQVSLEDWAPKGTWVRLGIQQTPYVDFIESVYRYRFQGPVFVDREGYSSSSDAGASAHYALPSNYGDLQFGVFNGETYNKPETNDQKALEGRATLRPFAKASPLLQGLRATIFYDADHYVQGADRTRMVAALTFEHPRLNAGFEYLKAKDQTGVTKPEIEGNGFSLFVTPRAGNGFEGLVRYDRMTPNKTADTQQHKRTVIGVAYWVPHPGGTPLAAIMLDYEKANFDNFVPVQPTQGKISLHGLVNF